MPSGMYLWVGAHLYTLWYWLWFPSIGCIYLHVRMWTAKCPLPSIGACMLLCYVNTVLAVTVGKQNNRISSIVRVEWSVCPSLAKHASATCTLTVQLLCGRYPWRPATSVAAACFVCIHTTCRTTAPFLLTVSEPTVRECGEIVAGVFCFCVKFKPRKVFPPRSNITMDTN